MNLNSEVIKLLPLCKGMKHFIDVGTGEPDSEAWVVKKLFPEADIIGMEPQKSRYQDIKDKLPGTLIETAVWSSDGEITMYDLNPTRKPHKHLKDMAYSFPVEGSGEGYCVPCVCLDTIIYTNDMKSDICIWADIEGAELEVLRGAEKALKDGLITSIILELRSVSPYKKTRWCTAGQVIDFLKPMGYKMTKKTSSSFNKGVDNNKTFERYDALFQRI